MKPEVAKTDREVRLPKEHKDPGAAELGLDAPTSFPIFSSWCCRYLPGPACDRLQQFTEVVQREHLPMDRWGINEDRSITLAWGNKLSVTFTDKAEQWQVGGREVAVPPGRLPVDLPARIREALL